MADRTSELIAAYIENLPITAVSITPEREGLAARLTIGFDPSAVTAFWFRKSGHAELVATTAADDLRELGSVDENGFVGLYPDALATFVIRTAAELGAVWQSDLEVKESASYEVEKIIFTVEIGRRNGDLREVNGTYKKLRLEAKAAGHKCCSYNTHLATFTRNLVVRAAQHSSA